MDQHTPNSPCKVFPLLLLNLPIQTRLDLPGALAEGQFSFFERITELPPAGVGFAFPVRVYVQIDDIWDHLSQIPEEVLERIRGGDGVLLLDSSGEGRQLRDHDPEGLHRQLEALRIPLRKVLLLSHNRLVQAQYNEWLDGQGLREGVGICLIHSFLWMLLNAMDTDPEPAACDKRQEWMESAEYLAQPRSKKFLCLNFTPRDHRIAMVLYILKKRLQDEGYISFPGISGRKLQREIDDVRRRKINRMAPNLLTALPELIERSPFTLDVSLDERTNPSALPDFKLYQDSYFSMVTETEVNSTGRRRFTEKIFKPVLGGQPFLVLGLAHTLEDFRALGFKTFSPWISEEYDNITDTEERLAAVLMEFSRLCAFKPSQWAILLTQLRDTVVHNHRWFRENLRSILEREQLAPFLHELKTRSGQPA